MLPDTRGSLRDPVRTSSGVPCLITAPTSSVVTRSEMRNTKSVWCSTSRTPTPDSRMTRITAPRCSISAGVSPPAGSSSRMKRGRCARPRAISRKRCSACSSRFARRPIACDRPTPCSSSSARGAFALVGLHLRQRKCRREEAGAGIAPAAEHGIVEHGERRQQPRLLESACDPEAGASLHRRA